MKQMKEFQEIKIKPEKTWKNRHTIKSNNERKGMKKCWNYHYHLVKKEKSQMKKKEEELYYNTATLNLKASFVTILYLSICNNLEPYCLI